MTKNVLRKYFSLAVVMILNYGCDNTKQEATLSNDRLLGVLKLFTEKYKCDSCLNEFYIDKINPHYYELVVYQGYKSLCYEENNANGHLPNQYLTISDIKFAIYSGSEHYFNNQRYNPKKEIFDSISSKPESRIWVVQDSFNIIRVKQRNSAYPFMLMHNPQEIDVKLP